MGMQTLGKMGTRTGGPGTGDNKENEMVFENIQDVV
jgi:hypothetical protein